ncbi:dihydroneopterin triphosphate diphosphatase [Polynucleobacter sphagniphilus]|uniref:dATP pyrophosphohydrolase n=1 Tax=Polynucleobacter sphagniphilus TaxID=1743169 RepID=A0AA43M672_9BURK|nr:dihydroneopterin triphosphate diphosphatase [Polynucleobacter sphagniphilus]MDF9788605.1 dATP pyrophosphohydrolase [Polynucleobacter sphagniphilus]MDH6155184.1 dATP pyrophosphohydrolase [Polynucleobacter sphagniphilus]MDH6241772.1 dATP pyrophosphohydrolase [Polynucleobacter sphagniphilus]MDH6248795.1 dATP pyrophosphohydrolase [Polynucleobacter sphagniphilus]MDH6299696.1 dATP pyrophosphohydrolase [Polynucleobacter sphagniphilus]
MKIPISVLVVIYKSTGDVLLIERADRSGFWQSVTGSLDAPDEDLATAAAREVLEETGIDITSLPEGALQNMHHQIEYEIYPQWRYRYPPGITQNTEHWFSLEVPDNTSVTLAPREHVAYQWLPFEQAAKQCFSRSNGEAILHLFSA